MKKILILVSMFCLPLCFSLMAQSVVDVGHTKSLIEKNAAALGLSNEDLSNYRISDAYFDESTGLTMVYLQQTYKGVDVYNAITPVAFKNDKISAFQPGWAKLNNNNTAAKVSSKPSITALTALKNAFGNLNLSMTKPFLVALSEAQNGQEFEYDNMGVALNNVNVRLMWVPASENSQDLVLCWQVSLITLKDNSSWLVKVNAANGSILRKDNLTTKETFAPDKLQPKRNVYAYEVESFDNDEVQNKVDDIKDVQTVASAKFNVIPYPYMDPDHAAQTLVTNPWTINGNAKAYTKKWNSDTKDYDSLKGNNIFAYADWNHDNKPDFTPKSQTALPNLTWNYIGDFNSDPKENPEFGVVNLFYWTNLMHDMSYDYGFDEPAGNMQTINMNRGGKQNDFVLAEAQDGGDTSNANFAPAVDGKQSRMQMFLWRPSILKLFRINSPASIAGPKLATESAVSNNNKIVQKGTLTYDIVLYKDALHTDSSTACGSASNAAQISGHFAYIDRGSCDFVTKFINAQSAGAKGIIVGNVAKDDPRYHDNTTGDVLITMSGSNNSITIPGVFVMYDTAVKIKNNLKNNITVNASMTPTPMIDGDVDNAIPAHEYTHGISNRLTGGPSTVSCLNNGEQMGEGWSDYYALMMTTNWATAKLSDSSKPRPIGNYASGLDSTYGGIRVYPYSKNFSVDPWTYDSLQKDTSIHEYNAVSHPEVIYYTGELWCSTLWDMTWDLIKAEGINKTFLKPTVAGGNTTAMKLVMQGLKLQKCSPGCLDGRDAILKADTALFSASHSALIWKAFARRGMGYSAVEGSSAKIKDGHGAYDLPPGVSLQSTSTVVAEDATRSIKPEVTIGPNPTRDYLMVNIPGNKEKLNVQLMNNNGAVVGAYVVTNDNLKIDVSKLAGGVYNLLISGSDYTSKFKVIVQ
ncbi:MAG: M36 family metallopeptidase [Parafilimonas sp.]|nr:M36 family metallopeptidase [Parafilimonas sp.]